MSGIDLSNAADKKRLSRVIKQHEAPIKTEEEGEGSVKSGESQMSYASKAGPRKRKKRRKKDDAQLMSLDGEARKETIKKVAQASEIEKPTNTEDMDIPEENKSSMGCLYQLEYNN